MSRPRPARLATAVLLLLIVAAAVAVIGIGLGRGGPAAPSPQAGVGPPSDAVRAGVVRIVDGDTLVVEVGGSVERLRYIGIDAPELRVDAGPPECWAEASTEVHRDLASGSEIWLQRDVNDRDRFGRLLRHAWVEREGVWLHVGEALVRRGAARARSYPPDTAEDDRLARAERDARAMGAGLWDACASGR